MLVTVRCIFSFFVLSLPALGADRTLSQYVHKAWLGKDGAPANINAITQTKDGYLWLASTQGLYRFDGVQFERFRLAGQPMAWAPTYTLLSSPNGDLWVGSAVSGVSLLRNGTNRNYTGAEGFPEGAVLSLAQDRRGSIWAATQGGLARFDGAKWQKLGPEWGLEGTALSLYVDRNGTLWASTPNTVFDLPAGAARFHGSGNFAAVMQLLESPSGTLWIAESQRAVRPMPPAKGLDTGFASRQILFDRDGALWIPTLGVGLRRVPHADHANLQEIETLTAKDGLSADSTDSVFQDREGNIWVGSSAGLDRFAKGAVVRPPVPGKFNNSVMAPAAGGDVWVGCLNGAVGRIHGNQWIPPSEQFTAFWVVSDPAGGAWWASLGKGGYRENNGHFAKFEFPGLYETNGQPIVLGLDHSGALWLAGTSGVFVRRDGTWKAVDLPAGFPGMNPKVAYTGPSGRLWFGYREKVILLIDGTGLRVLSARDGLRVGAVEAVFESGSSTWIGGSEGLQLFDGQHFRDIAPADGDTFGSVSGLAETPEGSLWLNAVNGIVRIAPPAVSKLKAGGRDAGYSMFDAYDGLPGATQQTLPFQTLIQAKDGKLWFGNSGGPVWLDPADLPRNEIPPPVAVRSLTTNGKRYDSFAGLRLPALTRDLQIDYSAMSFTIPERVHFRYKLEGSDNNWQDAGNRRQAFYTNLGPGPYRFQVAAANNDGVWNETGAAVSFRIDPAYYQTLWFQALCYLTGLALLWFLYRSRSRASDRLECVAA